MTQGMTTINDRSSRIIKKCKLSKKCVIISGIGMAISSIVLFIIFWCTSIFQNTILSTLVIKNNTPMFDWFIRPPIRAVYKIKVFNYTNVDDYQSGKDKKLKVEEVGPYIYRETIIRINPVFHSNGTISFQEKRSFQWEGGHSDDEIVIVPNVPLLSAIAFLRDSNFFAQLAFTGILTTLKTKLFISVPAGNLIWGYDDNIFELSKPFISILENIPFEKFGLLAIKNGVSKDVLTLDTGERDLNSLGLIRRFNGQKQNNFWKDERCDRIAGTQGFMFPNSMFNQPNATIEAYSADMCRVIPLSFHGPGSSFGIPTLTFKPVADIFNTSSDRYSCFCPTNPDGSGRTCPPVGIANTSICNFNMPILASFPHFYGGDKKLLKNFEGLNPQQHLHETLLELHPRLGVVVGGHSRIQMNVEVRKATGIPFLGNIKDGQIFPLIWIDVCMDSIPDYLLKIFQHAYFTATTVENSIQWGSIVGIILSTLALIHSLKRHKAKHSALRRNVSGQNKLLEENESI